jgi:hypothetical protein
MNALFFALKPAFRNGRTGREETGGTPEAFLVNLYKKMGNSCRTWIFNYIYNKVKQTSFYLKISEY